MTELSPAAQVVLAAANNACCYGPDDVLNDSRWIAAAALRAVAEECHGLPDGRDCTNLLAEIAAELESQ